MAFLVIENHQIFVLFFLDSVDPITISFLVIENHQISVHVFILGVDLPRRRSRGSFFCSCKTSSGFFTVAQLDPSSAIPLFSEVSSTLLKAMYFMSPSCRCHAVFICFVPNTGTRLVIFDVLVTIHGRQDRRSWNTQSVTHFRLSMWVCLSRSNSRNSFALLCSSAENAGGSFSAFLL